MRVRIAGDEAFLTIKGAMHGVSRAEFEYAVPLHDAEQMLALSDGPVVEKIRHKVFYQGLTWEVDEFLGENLGLVVAEVEPFKTAISLRMIRAWPFLLFVFALLFAGLFIERFYCRYLCPLGAGLAIPAKLKIFDWLKRRPQCGRECRLCETKCTVGAIDPLGRINVNECVLCLRCQVIMNDGTQCPVLKRRARSADGGAA